MNLPPFPSKTVPLECLSVLLRPTRAVHPEVLSFRSWASDFTGYDSADLPTHFPFFLFLNPCFCCPSSQVLACIDWMLAEHTLFCSFCTLKASVFQLLSSEKRDDIWFSPYSPITIKVDFLYFKWPLLHNVLSKVKILYCHIITLLVVVFSTVRVK